MNRHRVIFVIIVAFLGGLLSFSLLYHHHLGDTAGGFIDTICGGGQNSGCGIVNSSEYSTLLGIPLAALGAYFYFTLAVLFAFLMFYDSEIRQFGIRLGFTVVSVAVVVDLIYLGIQIFIIGRFCTLCIMTYILTGILFFLMFRTRKGKPGTGFLSLLRTREGRLFCFSVANAMVMLGVAVFMTNAALANADVRKVEQRLIDQAISEFEASKIYTPNISDAPSLGDATAPIRVVIFSDFLCPWCRSTAKYFEQNMPQWKDRVQVTFLNYPLDPLCNPYQKTGVHSGSCWSALGGLCAQEQQKFWEFHDRIYDNPPNNPTGQDIMKIAYQVGIDTNTMKTCMTSSSMRQKVQTQIEEGHLLGITGTPRIFINGKLIPKLASLSPILKSEAGRLGIRPLENLEN